MYFTHDREGQVFALNDFHHWFKQSVLRWFNIANDKAKERIRRAVEIDKVCLAAGLTLTLIFSSKIKEYSSSR